MKFFRKHRKAVSPVIAVMLLVAVAVAAVGAYFIWFRSFQTQTQKSVQEQSSGALGGGLQVVSMTDDGSSYYVVIKNTLGSGGISINSTARVSPAATAGSTATVDVNGTRSVGAGLTTTLRLTPTAGAYTLRTGTTRTFTFEGNAGAIVVTTYTDS